MQTLLTQKYPCQISIHTFDDSIFHGTAKWGQEKPNYLANFRLFLGRVLPKNTEKCLYLDTDMLVLSDVRELFEIDLGENILGANLGLVDYDELRLGWVKRQLMYSLCHHKSFDFSKVEYYFCSGLLLVNVPKWHEYDIEAKCIEFIKTYNPDCPDQDALNACIDNKLYILPVEYALAMFQAAQELNNKNSHFTDEIHNALKNAKIVHFNGKAHPWLSQYRYLHTHYLPLDYPYTQKWWELALSTPEFSKDLQMIYDELNSPQIMFSSYIKALADKLEKMELNQADIYKKMDKIIAKQNPFKYLTNKCLNSLRKRLKKIRKGLV